MLIPNQFKVNDAWIAFRLNKAPIRTERDGAFDCIALMDAASCFLLCSELIPAKGEPSAAQSQKLLSDGQRHHDVLPKTLYVPTGEVAELLIQEASRLAIDVVRVPERELLAFIGEARQGFTEKFGSALH